MISRFFIERPILANVIAILTIILGGSSRCWGCRSRSTREITPPTVQVTATYPGASARVVADTIALPIEQQVNGVQDMLYMQSTSASDGTYKLVVTFKVGTDLDMAQVLVQNRVATAVPQLPLDVQKQGAVTKKVSTAILQVVDPHLPRRPLRQPVPEQLRLRSTCATCSRGCRASATSPSSASASTACGSGWTPRCSRPSGSTRATWSTPSSSRTSRCRPARSACRPRPRARASSSRSTWPAGWTRSRQFENIIVKIATGQGGRIIRVEDVGRVELGAQTYSQFCKFDGRPSAGVAIFQLPGANALAGRRRGRAERWPSSAKSFPQGLAYAIPFDTTQFTRASINEVYQTLYEAAALVLLVIMVFLQNWRATLVPATTVPVTIIGAFIAMAAMGFTVNMVTLFALILAIGIVVDDAIVIVEGAAHGIETGHDARSRPRSRPWTS